MNGEDFKNRREKLGLSRDDVALATGVTISAVCLWETGKRKVPKHAKNWLLRAESQKGG